ncbi:TRAP-type C4-dicarboxylate transport system permease small subunit [Rhizobium rosettiformans]|uniref:TRAP transporter small permease protein n=2 Tax=Rhizobium rosettiformans TaxID=1368430 RepID=A0A4S8Q1X0_9HYPH|nr:TRAP transporter small permease [Rhizobium rosettiformans]MBB5274423.1 TRAP-type C4-dicarboxylate transport system permease small subunit [Rhizobium rosettiformans]THV37960.1 TRAP transporter small permease [Rhizobium rosettiformans W3]
MATASSTGFDRLERACHGLAASLVLFGGLCLVVACGLTVASILGGLTLRPLPGEIELVEALCGLAVFAFLPYCQLKRGHVGVDILISAFGPKAMNWTQLIGDIVIAVLIGLVTWRHAVGTMDKIGNGETTPLLLMPVWWGFAVALALLVVNVIVCLFVIAADIRDMRRGKTIVAAMGAH